MTYELWDLASRNMIDWSGTLAEAVEAVQAYVDADDADTVMLFVHEDLAGTDSRTFTGADLVAWLESTRDHLRHTA